MFDTLPKNHTWERLKYYEGRVYICSGCGIIICHYETWKISAYTYRALGIRVIPKSCDEIKMHEALK